MEDQDVIREFVAESHENLSRLDLELVELEKCPQNRDLLDSIFRTIHTIKGTCGFFAFSTLESISHQAENLLSQLRDGQRELDPGLISLILETVDATRRVLAAIEETGQEGTELFQDLTERLTAEVKHAARDRGRPAPRHAAPHAITHEAVHDALPAPASAAPSSNLQIRGSFAAADANVRVAVPLLDKLMDLVGELVLARNQILQFNAQRDDAALNATSQRLDLITTELQEGVMKTRMQPIGTVWNKLPRLVRDMSVSLGKQIQLEMRGSQTELDRTIIEAIKDPLVHLVRNACDHGIETPDARVRAGKPAHGNITLRARHEGGQVNIELADDGAGIDVERVKQKAVENGILRPEQAHKLPDREAFNLIFKPGFSTAAAVTNVSGRGVGMDVVKSNIERIGGAIEIGSRRGEGTSVKLKIPLTLAIIPGLVVSSGGERFIIPQVSLLELIHFHGESPSRHIEYVHGTPVYRRRGTLLPIAYLNRVLSLQPERQDESVNLVVLQAEDRQFGLIVDAIHDTQEIVVKPLGKHLKGMIEYAGATIMGDGRVALILDVVGIGHSSGVMTESGEQARSRADQAQTVSEEKQSLLLFRCGRFERLAVPLSLVARLEKFPLSAVEYAGGKQVVQYRDHFLPLADLSSILEPVTQHDRRKSDPLHVIVFHDADGNVGVLVDEILDIVQDVVNISQPATRFGLRGSAVVSKRITDFLDLNYVLRASRGNGSAPLPSQPDRISHTAESIASCSREEIAQ